MVKKKIIVLYSKLSDYILNTFRVYVDKCDVEIYIFKDKPDTEQAPFEFELKDEEIVYFDQNEYSIESLFAKIKVIKPDLILCGGWNNKKYLSVIKLYNRKARCVLLMDNQWQGTFRQYMGSFYFRLFLKSFFGNIWIPGLPQKKFAHKLGFDDKEINMGWYVANFSKFKSEKNPIFSNKRFLFVGRYVKNKGLINLIKAFIDVDDSWPSDWELHCFGSGPLKKSLPNHQKIKHFGFLQPDKLEVEAKNGGVFILPSHFEPWGVVVQEFALSGFPLLLSDKVGSASTFVDNSNGIIFKSDDLNSIKEALLRITQTSEEELTQMGFESINKAIQVNHCNWISEITKLLESNAH